MGIPRELIWTREMRADIEKRFAGYFKLPFAFRGTHLMKLFGASVSRWKKRSGGGGWRGERVQIMTERKIMQRLKNEDEKR